jgi:ketosteroid isomerase-like protein
MRAAGGGAQQRRNHMTTVTHAEPASWIARYYELCGAKDIDGAMEYWAPDGELRFANEEPVIGREAIRLSFKGFVDMWQKETHRLINLWELPGGIVIFELDIAFRMYDGNELDVHGMAVNRVDDQRFLEQRTYVDMGPVWAAAQKSASRAGVAG